MNYWSPSEAHSISFSFSFFPDDRKKRIPFFGTHKRATELMNKEVTRYNDTPHSLNNSNELAFRLLFCHSLHPLCECRCAGPSNISYVITDVWQKWEGGRRRNVIITKDRRRNAKIYEQWDNRTQGESCFSPIRRCAPIVRDGWYSLRRRRSCNNGFASARRRDAQDQLLYPIQLILCLMLYVCGSALSAAAKWNPRSSTELIFSVNFINRHSGADPSVHGHHYHQFSVGSHHGEYTFLIS